ncbi:MAG TPA: aspartyl/asparaginyl beta-hydroxylase domain-containing protein [Polyangiaceae bacterium]|nr:aspartyl/asparaginyl beta-hydroxylase domain-containing protein [Polyangiaceae bacterium]
MASLLSDVKTMVRDPTLGTLRLLNRVYRHAANGDRRPAFHDIDRICPGLRLLDRNYSVIREEMEGVLGQPARIPRYHEISPRETYISGTVDAEKAWRVFMLVTPVGVPRTNQARCPRTTALIRQVPNVIQAFFSILDPGKSIPAHSGDNMGYLRYHLGLRVPENNPPSIRVKDQLHTWAEGQSVVFDDSWEHEVYNRSDALRAVLIVDFFRPMPWPAHALNKLAVRGLPRYSEEAKQALEQIEKFAQDGG